MKPARIRAVLFDAGNTLLWIDHARVAEALTAVGLPCDEPAVREAEMRARPRLDPHLGHAPKRETPEIFGRYVDYLLDNLEVDPSAPEAGAARAELARLWPALWCRPPRDARATLRALRSRGYALGVVSNSNGRVSVLLAQAGLADLLDLVVDSGIEGVEKPDPRIFTIAAERLGVPAAEILYVGDFFSIDVLGARRAGLEALLLDPIDCWTHVDAPRIRALGELLDRL